MSSASHREDPGANPGKGDNFFIENKYLLKFEFEWSYVESRFYAVSGSW